MEVEWYQREAGNSRNKKTSGTGSGGVIYEAKKKNRKKMGDKVEKYEKATDESGMIDVEKRSIRENRKEVDKLDKYLQVVTWNVRGLSMISFSLLIVKVLIFIN